MKIRLPKFSKLEANKIKIEVCKSGIEADTKVINVQYGDKNAHFEYTKEGYKFAVKWLEDNNK